MVDGVTLVSIFTLGEAYRVYIDLWAVLSVCHLASRGIWKQGKQSEHEEADFNFGYIICNI